MNFAHLSVSDRQIPGFQPRGVSLGFAKINNSNCKRKRRFLAITYCKIRSSLGSTGGSIPSVPEGQIGRFSPGFTGVRRFHLQFELISGFLPSVSSDASE